MSAPLRVAVVGSGPAGFYAADALLRSEDPSVAVDLLDRLPTPWGLVRLGVAPDHENIKAVSRAFEKTAARPGFRFFGNVDVGRAVTHAELLERYDAVVYTVGAQTDRHLGIPGEDLPGSWPATAFVAWYNGHPDFQDLSFDLSTERVVVVGNGNVAIDCARMLALTAAELASTDTVDAAERAIVDSGIREIVMLGRRGPVQAAFTPPELQELGELAGADVVVDPHDLELDPASADALEHDRERARRNVELLREFAAREPKGLPRRIMLRFLVSPVEIVGDGRVEARRGRSQPARLRGRQARCAADGRPRDHPLRSRPPQRRLPGRRAPRVSRSTRMPGVMPNEEAASWAPTRTYCAGWIKRGPSGVIGTNKKDATETVDAPARGCARREARSAERRRSAGAARGTGNVPFVEYDGWRAIDAAERAAGEPLGRPRVKLTGWSELLDTGRSVQSSS